MASSGSFTSNTTYAAGSDFGRYVQVDWSVTSQNVASNTSTLSWTAYSKNPKGERGHYVECFNSSITINGTTVYAPSNHTQTWDNGKLASGTMTIAHNSDGTKSVSWNITFNFYTGGSANSTGSGSFTLNTIARASSVSVSPASIPIGSTTSISINRQSTSFTHSLDIKVGTATKKSFTGVGTSQAFTPDYATFAPLNTTGTSMSATVYCTTYSGSTNVGQSSCALTITIPNNSTTRPTVSKTISFSRVFNGFNLNNVTQMTVVNTASAKYSATIKSYDTKLDGTSIGTTATINNKVIAVSSGGSKAVLTTVTDSRGFTAQDSVPITVTQYNRPTITLYYSKRASFGVPVSQIEYISDISERTDISKIYILRQNNVSTAYKYEGSGWNTIQPNEHPDGIFVMPLFEYSCTTLTKNGSNVNPPTITVRWKRKDQDIWSTAVPVVSGEFIDTTLGGVNEGISPNYTYDLEYRIQDAVGNEYGFTAVTRSDFISTSFTLLDFAKYGKSMAIGKISEAASLGEESCLEVGIPSYFYEGLYAKKAIGTGFANIVMQDVTSECNFVNGWQSYASAASNKFRVFDCGQYLMIVGLLTPGTRDASTQVMSIPTRLANRGINSLNYAIAVPLGASNPTKVMPLRNGYLMVDNNSEAINATTYVFGIFPYLS